MSQFNGKESKPIGSYVESHFLKLSRFQKRLILVVTDFISMLISLWVAYALRLADIWPIDYIKPGWWLFAVIPTVGIIIFIRLNLYKTVLRFMGGELVWRLFSGAMLLATIIWAIAFLTQLNPFSRSVPVIFGLATILLMGGSRLLFHTLYKWLAKNYTTKERVLIYGAGGAGVQLAYALSGGKELSCEGFIDDSVSLHNSLVAGLNVYAPDQINNLISAKSISFILLAMPSLSANRKKEILEDLTNYPVHVKTIPTMHEIVSGQSMTTLREIQIEDLLGRDVVPPMAGLFKISLDMKVVLVTGAGGSIGSEICHQILFNTVPKVLILFERSEYALYEIEMAVHELKQELNLQFECHAILGSVTDAMRVKNVINHFGVDTIYHAAAYKHVPIVEHNIIEGIRNNSIGTKVVADAAVEADVERFILISTDKAVRPTNVMGATKRLAELILQDTASRSEKTVFSMVRFGNVLGSSGSVVPLFRKQIENGGPVTVTHPEITRYFMTIPEAAALVIQAGSMAEGGDVFVLDMGEPVKITDLAQRMIRLMGHQEKELDSTESKGHAIEVRYTGLRPGEKLYEELLIGVEVVGTSHPKIMRAIEESFDSEYLEKLLQDITNAMESHDTNELYELLRRSINGFCPNSPMVDYLKEST